MKSIQIQFTIDLPKNFGNMLKAKADALGLSVSELVQRILVEEVKEKEYPTFKASKATIRETKQVMKDYEEGRAVTVNSTQSFLESQNYPVKKISKRSERRLEKALQEKDKAVDASTFFAMLTNES